MAPAASTTTPPSPPAQPAPARQSPHQGAASQQPATAARSPSSSLPASVSALYASRKGKPLWQQDDSSLSPAGEDLLKAVENSNRHGLTLPPLDRQARDFDQQLTSQALTLALALHNGVLQPPPTDGERHNDLDAATALHKIATSPAPGQWIEAQAPRLWLYGELQQALEKARAIEAAGGWPGVPPLSVKKLKPGDAFADAPAWRKRMAATGELDRALQDDPTPVYDPPLVEAVKAFQRSHGLEDDGVVGRQTRAAINFSAHERVQQVKVNLDRLRWLPMDLGNRYVFVNIPGFQAWVIDNGKIILDTPVIVGKGQQQTPAFSDTIRSVVLNPSWEVPRSIALKEILPKLAQDPGYLAHENMDAFSGWENGGTLVDPYTVDWKSLAASERLPYRFRQRPGPKNSLGLVKLLFPNAWDVYLHDTPSRGLFNLKVRAFSHGCMRVGKAQELAALALGWPLERVQETIAKGQETRLKVASPLPIHITYLTAWLDPASKAVEYRDDLYQRDAALLGKMPAILMEP